MVNFDVDYGQVIEYMCPRGSLTDEEGTALCYMSFPDSHATSLGDTEFVFRVRRSSPAGSTPNAWRPSLEPETDDGSGEAAPFEDATHSKRYLFGYTLFRQVGPRPALPPPPSSGPRRPPEPRRSRAAPARAARSLASKPLRSRTPPTRAAPSKSRSSSYRRFRTFVSSARSRG